jgi:hypothetical protein
LDYCREQLPNKIVLKNCGKRFVLFFIATTAIFHKAYSRVELTIMPCFGITTSQNDSLLLSLNGINLSEDMSTLSSKNDEVLVLLYSFDDTLTLEDPLFSEYLILDSSNRKKQMPVFVSDRTENVLLIMAELDTDRSPEQVEKLIRKNFKGIMSCLDKRDLIALQQYVGDDDIIGIRILRSKELADKTTFSFQGRYKLDKFLYRIEIKRLTR